MSVSGRRPVDQPLDCCDDVSAAPEGASRSAGLATAGSPAQCSGGGGGVFESVEDEVEDEGEFVSCGEGRLVELDVFDDSWKLVTVDVVVEALAVVG